MATDTLKDATARIVAETDQISMADVNRGYLETPQCKTERYDPEDSTSTQVGNPMEFNPGALGRPRGWAR